MSGAVNLTVKLLWVLAASSSLFAGQSITLSSQLVFNSSIPGIAPGGAVDVVMSISGWGTPTSGSWAALSAADISTNWASTSPPVMQLYSNHETGWTGSTCTIPLTGYNLIKIRYQRVPLTSTTGRDICQAWSETGAVITDFTSIYSGVSSTTPTNGMAVGGGTSLDFAYIRMFTANVAENATPPATAESQTGMVFQWKFDNSLADSTGSGYTGTLSSGSPTYVSTPYQTLVVASAQGGATCTLPPFTNWVSFNTISSTNCLTAATSYADADASAAVTAAWSNVSGPATPTIASPSSVSTNVSAASTVGLYTFGLTVTAVSGGGTASTTIALGAVPMDAGGILQPADPRVNAIYNGPMIAFGLNPWTYEDERNYTAIRLQIAQNGYYSTQTTWTITGQGTGSYPFAGIGPAPSGIPGATLNGAITATATSISIHNAERLPGLLHLPTAIYIGGWSSPEMVRISATTATTGNATLTVAYDGRGLAGTPWGSAPVGPASSWADNTAVGEMRLSGSGTLYISDSQRPLAPAGLGPMGPVTYSTGTAQLSASSGAIAGVSTKWSQTWGNASVVTGSTTITTGTPYAFDTWFSGAVIYLGAVPYTVASNTSTALVLSTPYAGVTNVAEPFSYGMFDAVTGAPKGYMIRVQATHASGTPFVWWSEISSVNSATSITAVRNAPADVDTATNFSYQILGPRYLSLEFADPVWGGTKRLLQNGQYCESETACFATPEHDIPAFDALTFTGAGSYKNALGCCSSFGPNFYGTGLAARAFYLRSGWTPALTLANQIDDYWIRDPEVGSGYNVGETLLYGGGFQGALADAVLNPSSLVAWTDLRPWAASGQNYVAVHNTINGNLGCNSTGGADLRDQSYVQNFLTQASIYDPDDYQRNTWNNAMGAQEGSGDISQPTSGSTTVYMVLSGVTVLPGQNIVGPGLAAGTTVVSVGGPLASGQVSVTNGSTTVTRVSGDNFPTWISGQNISIGVSTGIYQLAGSTPTTLTLSTPYTGLTASSVQFFYGNIVTISQPTTAPISLASVTFPTASMFPRDVACARSDYSFAVPAMGDAIDGGANVLTKVDLINGSASAVAHSGTIDLTGICQGVASGTISVTNSSTAATLISGSLGTLATNLNLVITDTTSSPNNVGFLNFSFTGSSVTLAGAWPFATGTFSFIVNQQKISGVDGIIAIGNRNYSDADNVRQQEGWGCTQVDATHVTLNRPWNDAVTGGSVHPTGTYTILNAGVYGVPVIGYYTQPFMYGILGYKASTAAYYSPYQAGSINSTYLALLPNMANWFKSTAYDFNTQGVYYTTVNDTCEPQYTAISSGLIFPSIHGAPGNPCDYSGLMGAQDNPNYAANLPINPSAKIAYPIPSEYTSRSSMAEGFSAVIAWYKSQCLIDNAHCVAARSFGDTAYGAMFGNPFMTAGGFYQDNHYVNTAGELANSSLGYYKYTGFFFGMGMGSNAWPAIRQGNPTSIITWPIQHGTMGGIATMTGSAQAYGATVTNVDLSIDGGSFSAITGPLANWSTPINQVTVGNGTHTFAVRVTDSNSLQTTTTTTASMPARTQLCAHTLVTTGVYCEQALNAGSSSNTATVTFSSGHTAGQLIVVGVGGCCQSTRPTAAVLTNTDGYTWLAPAGAVGTGYSDGNIVNNLLWYTFVPSTTGSSDTLTITFPSATNSMQMYAVVYSGLSSVDGAGTGTFGWGPYSAQTGSYPVTIGDLNVAFLWGAPYYIAGWQERIEDNSRPIGIIVDQIATTNTANAQWIMNPEGFTGVALAFKPGGTTAQGGTVISGQSKVSGATSIK